MAIERRLGRRRRHHNKHRQPAKQLLPGLRPNSNFHPIHLHRQAPQCPRSLPQPTRQQPHSTPVSRASAARSERASVTALPGWPCRLTGEQIRSTKERMARMATSASRLGGCGAGEARDAACDRRPATNDRRAAPDRSAISAPVSQTGTGTGTRVPRLEPRSRASPILSARPLGVAAN